MKCMAEIFVVVKLYVKKNTFKERRKINLKGTRENGIKNKNKWVNIASHLPCIEFGAL